MPKRRVLAFGEYGGVASAICNNLIAYLLFFCVSAMHLLGRCSALGPGPGSLPRPSSSPSSRTWPCALFAPHLVPCGTAWHSGAPGVLRRGVGAPLASGFSPSNQGPWFAHILLGGGLGSQNFPSGPPEPAPRAELEACSDRTKSKEQRGRPGCVAY